MLHPRGQVNPQLVFGERPPIQAAVQRCRGKFQHFVRPDADPFQRGVHAPAKRDDRDVIQRQQAGSEYRPIAGWENEWRRAQAPRLQQRFDPGERPLHLARGKPGHPRMQRQPGRAGWSVLHAARPRRGLERPRRQPRRKVVRIHPESVHLRKVSGNGWACFQGFLLVEFIIQKKTGSFRCAGTHY